MRELVARIAQRARRLSPVAILALGFAVFLLYAYPGYMSFDSVYQLLEARSGELGDAHPPMMGAMWHAVDMFIAGPFGMLVIQVTAFLVGAYLILRSAMSQRVAAVLACFLLLVPPVSAVMAVIWKDSQMAGFLLLGAGLLLSERRIAKIGGLLSLVLATGMRHNAFAMTFAIVLLLFVWTAQQKWWKRYPIAVAAWVGVTIAAQVGSGLLTQTTKRSYLWHDALALWDIVGTLRYAEPISDEELLKDLEGTPLRPKHDIQDATRKTYRPDEIAEKARLAIGNGEFVTPLWTTTYMFFDVPKTMPERHAIARAWKKIVLTHPRAYLHYRWNVFVDRIQLGTGDIPSAAYVWFTDVLDPATSATKIGHSAMPAGIQGRLREWMRWLGSTFMFRPYVYLLLTLLLLPFCRDRLLLALAGCGIGCEAALFLVAPTVDYRYSFGLVISTILLVMLLIARRAQMRPSQNS